MTLTNTTTVSHPAPGKARAGRRPRWAGVALLLSGALLLAACGDDASDPEPTGADTGVPLNVGTADPAASPTSGIAP